MYKVDLINNSGSTSSNNLTVYVNNNVVPPVEVPLKGLLTVDNINNMVITKSLYLLQPFQKLQAIDFMKIIK